YLREDNGEVLYLLPEDATPTIDTTKAGPAASRHGTGGETLSRVLKAGLLTVGNVLHLEYGPRGSKKERFEATVRADGLEVDGRVFSPSYAAVHCMKRAGSERRTANGWVMWKTADGILINDLAERLPQS